MHKDTFTLLICLLDELKDLLGCDVILVEKNLLLLVQPVKCQVNHAHAFPLVLYLLARAIDDLGDFVGNHKLDILGCKFVANEQTIFNFDCSYHVLRKHHHLLLLLLELELLGLEHGHLVLLLLSYLLLTIARLLLRHLV